MAAGRGRPAPRRQGGFTLVELVIVVTILGVIAGIAVPRLTTASASAQRNALRATLSNIRKAIDRYYAEHGVYPGYKPPNGGEAKGDRFVKQLLLYSDANGYTNDAKTSRYKYGPYLRPPFPKNPANSLDKVHMKKKPTDADPAVGTVGWVGVLSTGAFGISATDAELDKIGVLELEQKQMLRLQN